MHWQSAGGLSYVAAAHHRVAQRFKYHGNSLHGAGMAEVTLSEFQDCIKLRHRLGSRGMETDATQATQVATADDYK